MNSHKETGKFSFGLSLREKKKSLKCQVPRRFPVHSSVLTKVHSHGNWRNFSMPLVSLLSVSMAMLGLEK